MILGLTGTRQGTTEAQRAAFLAWLATHPVAVLHQGCATGADAEISGLIAGRCPGVVIVGHPSDIPSQASPEAVMLCDVLHEARPPLDRNRVIVEACEGLVAFPAGMAEEVRSGTWATFRHARRLGRKRRVFWPDGVTTAEM